MKKVEGWLRRHRRGVLTLILAIVLVGVAYLTAATLHRAAIRQVEVARVSVSRGDWLEAIRCLNSAFREDRFLDSEARLLRAAAINGYISAYHKQPAGYTRTDALADVEVYLRNNPSSGEAHHQRASALSGLGKVEEARTALATAIPLLADPTNALVDRASLSFHVSDYRSAIDEITLAIDRQPLVAEYYEQRGLYRMLVRDFRGASLDKVKAAKLNEDPTGTTLSDLSAVRTNRDDRPIRGPQDAPVVIAERAQFAGDWSVLIRESEGAALDTSDADYSYQFDDDRYSVLLDGTRQPDGLFRLDLDPARQCFAIDLIRTINGRTVTLLGVYEFRGETLRLCVAGEGEPRPPELTTLGLDGATLLTLKRAPRKRVTTPRGKQGGAGKGH